MNANQLVEIPGLVLNLQCQLRQDVAIAAVLGVALVCGFMLLRELIRRGL